MVKNGKNSEKKEKNEKNGETPKKFGENGGEKMKNSIGKKKQGVSAMGSPNKKKYIR